MSKYASKAKVISCSYEKFENFLKIGDRPSIGYLLEKAVAKAIDSKELDPSDSEELLKFVTDKHNELSPKKKHVSYDEVRRDVKRSRE